MPEQTLIEQLAAVLNVEIIPPLEGSEAQGIQQGPAQLSGRSR